MSKRAIDWAFEQTGMTPTEKFILVAMAESAGDAGKTYSTNAAMCRITGLAKEETVSDAQSKLIKLGLIKDTGQRVGSTGKVKVFQLPDAACKNEFTDESQRGGS